jgi:hypothetical protein
MCAVCFCGIQAVPAAIAAARVWWVKRTTNDAIEGADPNDLGASVVEVGEISATNMQMQQIPSRGTHEQFEGSSQTSDELLIHA